MPNRIPEGCVCEYGCSQCGYHLTAMGNCPAWTPCPVGREPNPNCPVHAEATP